MSNYNKIKQLVKSIIPIDLYRYRRAERRLWKDCRDSMIEEVIHADKQTLLHYIVDLDKYHVSFIEWNLYNFSTISEEDKSHFLSRYDAQILYRKFINPELRSLFFNKANFINHFKKFINRDIITSTTPDIEEKLRRLLSEKDIIMKPIEGTLGVGISKLHKDDRGLNIPELAVQISSGKYIAEECVVGIPVLQEYNESSLNTLRVVTAYDGENVEIFGAAVRFGNGNSIVDNSHNGGLRCSIDITSGIIDSNAKNSRNEMFFEHPTSKKAFKGMAIPMWEEICGTVKSMHRGIDLPFIGWDVAISKNNEIEIIEGNHAPDIDMMQAQNSEGLRDRFVNNIDAFKRNMIFQKKINNFPRGKF